MQYQIIVCWCSLQCRTEGDEKRLTDVSIYAGEIDADPFIHCHVVLCVWHGVVPGRVPGHGRIGAGKGCAQSPRAGRLTTLPGWRKQRMEWPHRWKGRDHLPEL